MRRRCRVRAPLVRIARVRARLRQERAAARACTALVGRPLRRPAAAHPATVVSRGPPRRRARFAAWVTDALAERRSESRAPQRGFGAPRGPRTRRRWRAPQAPTAAPRATLWRRALARARARRVMRASRPASRRLGPSALPLSIARAARRSPRPAARCQARTAPPERGPRAARYALRAPGAAVASHSPSCVGVRPAPTVPRVLRTAAPACRAPLVRGARGPAACPLRAQLLDIFVPRVRPLRLTPRARRGILERPRARLGTRPHRALGRARAPQAGTALPRRS